MPVVEVTDAAAAVVAAASVVTVVTVAVMLAVSVAMATAGMVEAMNVGVGVVMEGFISAMLLCGVH